MMLRMTLTGSVSREKFLVNAHFTGSVWICPDSALWLPEAVLNTDIYRAMVLGGKASIYVV